MIRNSSLKKLVTAKTSSKKENINSLNDNQSKIQRSSSKKLKGNFLQDQIPSRTRYQQVLEDYFKNKNARSESQKKESLKTKMTTE